MFCDKKCFWQDSLLALSRVWANTTGCCNKIWKANNIKLFIRINSQRWRKRMFYFTSSQSLIWLNYMGNNCGVLSHRSKYNREKNVRKRKGNNFCRIFCKVGTPTPFAENNHFFHKKIPILSLLLWNYLQVAKQILFNRRNLAFFLIT